MRRELASCLKTIAAADKQILFLTGDLGFNALEELRDSMKDRFINMGVAEQSMISVAAGLASKGFQVFCYSIAPFVTYRCLEQIRNDVCFHNLPVCIIGNGGGYGYGIMGSSHHAIEDLAIVSGLPNIQCYMPAFEGDVSICIGEIIEKRKPAYMRIGASHLNNFNQTTNETFNTMHTSQHPLVTVVGTGSVMQPIYQAITDYQLNDRVDVFSIRKLPYNGFTPDYIESVRKTKKIVVAEEHISIGGIGQQLALDLISQGILVDNFISLHAKGYPEGRYGSQQFHLTQSGLDKDSIAKTIISLI